MIRVLKRRIEKRYELIKIIGKGSYGCVTKAKCKETGKLVALKVMKNQTKTEYEIIKLLREIQLLRKMNEIYQKANKKIYPNDPKSQENPFIPALIDIICPIKKIKKQSNVNLIMTPSCNQDSG